MFGGIQGKNFEARQGHILPALENVKGKYCRLRDLEKTT